MLLTGLACAQDEERRVIAQPGERISIYTSWRVYPKADSDCGGETITLGINRKTGAVRGFFQHYEGNCFSDPTEVRITDFRLDSGDLVFVAPEYSNVCEKGKESQGRSCMEWRFTGKVFENHIDGRISYCEVSKANCNVTRKKIRLRRTRDETL